MSIDNFETKKRLPNIIFGLVFGLLAIKLSPCFISYLFFIISALLFLYTDQIIKHYRLKVETGKFEMKMGNSKSIHRDKDGNIVSK